LRLCNSYLADQQVMLDRILLLIAAAIALFWIGHLFFRDAGGGAMRRL